MTMEKIAAAVALVLVVVLIVYLARKNLQSAEVPKSEGYASTAGKNSGFLDTLFGGFLGGAKNAKNTNAKNAKNANANAGAKPADSCGHVEGSFGPVAQNRVNPQLSNGSYEKQTHAVMQENIEYFDGGCGDSSADKEAIDCLCADGKDGAFAKFDYGAKDMDYSSFVASQAVDDQVIVNHANYIKDRKSFSTSGSEFTGKTFSPSDHSSYNSLDWIGLRRPERLPEGVYCNPTQVSDAVNLDTYAGNRQFCFKI